MKSFALALTLSVVVLGCSLVPAIGQPAASGVTTGYTLFVSFFYPFHFLYNLQVTVRDQNSKVLATALSPDGSQILIPIRTESPIITLTASVTGYASGPLTYYYPASTNYWPVWGQSRIPVEVIGGDYWLTVNLYP